MSGLAITIHVYTSAFLSLKFKVNHINPTKKYVAYIARTTKEA